MLHSKTFASVSANFENDHEEPEVSNKSAHKEEAKAKAGLIKHTTEPKRTCSASSKQVISISRQFGKLRHMRKCSS